MYYVVILVSIASTFFAARFCVAGVARIQSRWRRRLVFWFFGLPTAVFFSLLLILPVADDVYFLSTPSHCIAVAAPLLAFVLGLIWFAVSGFRDSDESKIPRARAWSTRQTGKRLLVSLALLILSAVLFDWELQLRLRRLKAASLNDRRSISQPAIPEDQNAAVNYMELEKWSEPLTAWNSRFESVAIDDFLAERFDQLRECDPAFEILRQGSAKPRFYLPRERDYRDQFAKDARIDLIQKAVRLFYFNLLANARRGEIAAAYDDIRVLLRVAIHLDGDVRLTGRFCGSYVRARATEALQRVLQFHPEPNDDVLRSLVNDQHNPRQGLPELFAFTETAHVTEMCDLYLGMLSDKDERELISPAFSNLPPVLKYLAHMLDRLARARDDLIAVRRRSDIYRSFAARWDDPTATSDALGKELSKQFPRGAIAGADSRDALFHLAAVAHDKQQLINIMAAVTLYVRQHGQYPEDLTVLAPGFLSQPPIGWTDGKPFRMQPLGKGLIVYGSSDQGDIENDLKWHNTVRPDTAKYLVFTVFMGEAFKLVFPNALEQDERSDAEVIE